MPHGTPPERFGRAPARPLVCRQHHTEILWSGCGGTTVRLRLSPSPEGDQPLDGRTGAFEANTALVLLVYLGQHRRGDGPELPQPVLDTRSRSHTISTSKSDTGVGHFASRFNGVGDKLSRLTEVCHTEGQVAKPLDPLTSSTPFFVENSVAGAVSLA